MRSTIWKKILAIVLAITLIAGFASAIFCRAAYHDTADHWASAYIDEATERGWMNGTGNGFAPDRPMTRAEVVTVLWRMDGEPPALHVSFDDVDPKAYYAVAVSWARREGIVNGVSDTTFAPNDTVTREQFATILWRFAGQPGPSGSIALFRDPNLTPWSADAFRWAVGEGIITGVEQNGLMYLLPKQPVTRAQAAAMLVRWEVADR